MKPENMPFRTLETLIDPIERLSSVIGSDLFLETQHDTPTFEERLKSIQASIELNKKITQYSNPCKYEGLYRFTTESIVDYEHILGDLTGKRCLSVAASGDHIIHLIAHGATDITLFDIDPTSWFWTILKLNLLASCEGTASDFKEACNNILIPHEANPFFWIASQLSMDVKEFWSKSIFAGQELFRTSHRSYGNSYLDDENFDNVRAEARQFMEDRHKILFINTDAGRLSYYGLEKFDVILMSNIPEYICKDLQRVQFLNNLFKKQSIMDTCREAYNFKKKVIDDIVWRNTQMLSKNGIMVADYNYAIPHSDDDAVLSVIEDDTYIGRREELKQLYAPRQGCSVEWLTFQSISSEHGGYDMVPVIQKH